MKGVSSSGCCWLVLKSWVIVHHGFLNSSHAALACSLGQSRNQFYGFDLLVRAAKGSIPPLMTCEGINSTTLTCSLRQWRDQFPHSDLLFRAVKRSIPPLWPALQVSCEVGSIVLTCSFGSRKYLVHSPDWALLFRSVKKSIPPSDLTVRNQSCIFESTYSTYQR